MTQASRKKKMNAVLSENEMIPSMDSPSLTTHFCKKVIIKIGKLFFYLKVDCFDWKYCILTLKKNHLCITDMKCKKLVQIDFEDFINFAKCIKNTLFVQVNLKEYDLDLDYLNIFINFEDETTKDFCFSKINSLKKNY